MKRKPWETPVYRAQVQTFTRARELCGIRLTAEQGLATPGDHPLATFRAFPQYRTQSARALRHAVAQSFKGR